MKKIKILVVEDERVVARDLCQTLEDLGYATGAAAHSGDEAIALAAAEAPDLVLIDIQIKGHADGIETAGRLKELYKVPVVFLTASTDEESLQRAFQVGPDGYLPKPFSRVPLRSAIEVALRRHGAEVQLREANEHLAAQAIDLEKRTNALVRLGELGSALQLCDSVDEVLALLGRLGQQLFPEDAGALYLVDSSATCLSVAASWGPPSARATFELDGCCALCAGQVHHCVPPNDQLCCVHHERGPELGSICVPLMANGTARGVLSLSFPAGTAREPAALAAKEQLATVVAHRIGLTLTNLGIMDQLKRESVLDPLTGLFNRRYMASTLERELRLATRRAGSVGVLIFDVDHFKRINDEFGHAAADKALCEVAALLRARLRVYDVPTRYGGDEIVVILPDTTLHGSLALGEHLHQGVRDLRIVHNGRTLPKLTISVGIAACPNHGGDAASVLQAADIALYRAKAAGRDRIAVAVRELPAMATEDPSTWDSLGHWTEG